MNLNLKSAFGRDNHYDVIRIDIFVPENKREE
jgi:hypothetical protein